MLRLSCTWKSSPCLTAGCTVWAEHVSAHSFLYYQSLCPRPASSPSLQSWQWQTCIYTHTLMHFTHTLNQPPSLTSFSYWNTHVYGFLRLRHVLFASLWVSHHYLERVPAFGHCMPPSKRWTEQLRHRLLVVTQLSQIYLITAVANVKAL